MDAGVPAERGSQVEQYWGKTPGDLKFQGLGKYPVADRLQSRH